MEGLHTSIKPHWKPLEIFEVSLNSCMNNISKWLYNGDLLSQALTDSVRKQYEYGQLVKDNGGCFTCKTLLSGTFDVCM